MWPSPCRKGRRYSGASFCALAILVPICNFILRAEDKSPPAKPQPLPFSHKLHTQFFPECLDCHQLASDGWTMSYPEEEKCMVCHATIRAESPAIKKLAEYSAQKKPVPWVQVYHVPDYVYFSHRTHLKKAKLECETCHGQVRKRDVLTKEKPTSMQACMSCHKEKGASVNCRTCHNSV